MEDGRRFLAVERAYLEAFLPKLDAALSGAPLSHWESRESEAITLFRDSDGPGLLVSREYAGKGARALDAVRVQRAVGSRSPSLAIATTMHHFSVATLVELAAIEQGMEWMLLQAIADNRMLVASGFAEGRSGQHILQPTLRARRQRGGLVVSGSKKPCSLTWSMDLMSASVLVEEEGAGASTLAIVLIPAKDAGIERRQFWATPILAGAESDEVVLRDVFVPRRMAFFPKDAPGRMDPVNIFGFTWFELLITSSYLGVASGLAERVLLRDGIEPVEALPLIAELDAAAAALERVALALDDRQDEPSDILALALSVRYAVQASIERIAMCAARLAGGMGFVSSPEVAYLLAAARALAFHPPAANTAGDALLRHMRGEGMSLGAPASTSTDGGRARRGA